MGDGEPHEREGEGCDDEAGAAGQQGPGGRELGHAAVDSGDIHLDLPQPLIEAVEFGLDRVEALLDPTLLPRWMTASGFPISTKRSTTDERVATMSV